MKIDIAKLLLVAGFSIFISGCKEENKSAEAEKFSSQEFCEGSLLVHLGDYALLVPRTKQDRSLSIELNDGTNLYQLHRPRPEYSCDIDEINNAVGVRWGRYEVSLLGKVRKHMDFKGSYAGVEEIYSIAKREGRVEKLDDGLEVINPEKTIYVLPSSKSLTLKNYPIAFVCDQFKEKDNLPILGDCRTEYVDSLGLYVRYSFSFNDRAPNEAATVEKERQVF